MLSTITKFSTKPLLLSLATITIFECLAITHCFAETASPREWEYAGDKYEENKQISIRLGERLFKSVSTFWKNGELATGLPVAIGITTHDEQADVSKDLSQGWMACWETIEGFDLGTGVVMDPSAIDKFIHLATIEADMSHALLITKTDDNGQVEYRAGYGWERAGEIKTLEDWQSHLTSF